MNYKVTLGKKLNDQLEKISKELNISNTEVLRRSLNLYLAAISEEVKKVILVTDSGERKVIVK